MTVDQIAEIITPEDFQLLVKYRGKLWEQTSLDKLFLMYEKYANILLKNEPGTKIINRGCGKCRGRVIEKITIIIRRKNGES